MAFRSSDKEYMDSLKTSVLHVTKGLEREDRKYALDYLRTHLKIDDLHQHALKHFPGKTIVFGEGTFQPKVVVVTNNPIKPDEKEKLEKAWTKLRVPLHDVYYAHLRFVATKKKQDRRLEIFNKLLSILSPNVILSFDGVEIETDKEWVEFPSKVSILTDEGSRDEKKKLTQVLKEVRPLILK
jgi:hypothetical protein